MISDEKTIIIFGASKAGEKTFNILREFNHHVDYFIDNDKNKWGKVICGKYIKSPETLRDINLDKYYIIIGSMFIEEISTQLSTYGLSFKTNFDNMYDYTKALVEDNFYYFQEKIGKENLLSLNKKTVVITLPNGISLGGVETLSATISNALNDKYNNAYLLNLKPRESDDMNIIGLKYKEKMLDLRIDYNNYLKSLLERCLKLTSYFPITIIPNHSDEIFLIASILKKIYPNFVKVISILHSVSDYTYEKNINYSNIINKFICVSDEIYNNFIELLPERREDIIRKISPVLIEGERTVYSSKGDALKIGFAGRLVKEAKRCDLLIDLISDLEARKINYELHIAGTGIYYDIINNFIKEKKLNNKIFLYGLIPNNKMNGFWKSMDIYINISDFEGTSIAMLEALGNGCVPIVTNVSGVRNFVEDNINGFIVDTQDFIKMADRIEYLCSHREQLYQFGQKCIKKVQEICSVEDYIEDFYSIL